jgi:streptomycin 6-kinase
MTTAPASGPDGQTTDSDEEVVARCATAWGLDLERGTATPSGRVFRGMRGTRPVILKVPRSGSDEMRQGQVLRHFGGKGAVRVLETDTRALLLEALEPGHAATVLTLAGRDDEATRIFCRIAGQLHAAAAPDDSFTRVSALASGFDRPVRGGGGRLPEAERLQARDLFLSLVRTQARLVPLHGDLHHENILFDRERGWVAIDPKGYAGEPEYEAGAWLRNPLGHLRHSAMPDRIAGRLAIISSMTGWNPRRVLQWSYAQAVLAALWAIEDGLDPDPQITAAHALRAALQVT